MQQEHQNDHHKQYIIQIQVAVVIVHVENIQMQHDRQLVNHVWSQHQVLHEHINQMREGRDVW